MATVKITIKHGPKTIPDVVFKAGSAEGLFSAIEVATGVPQARAKLMHKAWKGTKPGDADVAALTDGALVTVMGTAEQSVSAASSGVAMFVEDMPVAQQLALGKALPSGLINEQNTCYMNSVLEVMRAIPELRSSMDESAVVQRGGGGGGDADAALYVSLAKLFTRLDSSQNAVAPSEFLARLRAKNPLFGEFSQSGGYKQHDSEEFFSTLLPVLANHLTAPSSKVNKLLSIPESDAAPNVLDTLLGLELEVEMKCKECSEEPLVKRLEGARKLVANIDGGPGRPVQVNYLNEGVMLGLAGGGDTEKRSEVLGRNALWTKTSRVARLPKYLFVHLSRFFWKATNNAPGDGPAGVPCKILKPVSFPADKLDAMEFCTERIKTVLSSERKRADASKEATPSSSASSSSSSLPIDNSSNAASSSAAIDDIEMSSTSFPDSVGPLLPAGFLGYYELFGLVTHKGRDSKSGHYISWVRQSGSNWLIFDDDNVTPTDTKTVTDRLKGGGDDFMAYMLFYRAKSGE
jgi:ubiquitin carboxyl-terminal hydrolase 14